MVWVGLGFVFHAHGRTTVTRKVWIDTDISIGPPWREVDDAYALLVALRSPEVRVVGMSTTYGNAPLPQVNVAAKNFVHDRVHANIPIFAGAAGASERGRLSPASGGLAAAAANERITYLALGPLTNLATALQNHPRLRQRIESVVFVGGLEQAGQLRIGARAIHDANVFKDPAAVEAVLRSGIQVISATIAVGQELKVTRAERGLLRVSDQAGIFLARKSFWWLWFWTKVARADGGPVFDALPVLAVVRPDLVEFEERCASVDLSARALIVDRRTGRFHVRYCVGVKEGAKELLRQRLSAREATKQPSFAPAPQRLKRKLGIGRTARAGVGIIRGRPPGTKDRPVADETRA